MPVQKTGPDPASIHPLPDVVQIGFLKPIVDHSRIDVGDYTYYDDPAGPEHFVDRCVRYHFEHIGDRLIIGRFCAIAAGAEFIMNGANHLMDRLSTYPFEIFGQGWEDETVDYAKGSRGDIVIGNDVWIGTGATIMPGVKIGDGAVIGAKAVVAKDIPAFAVAAGNPAEIRKYRFPAETIDRLVAIAWWNWPVEKITRNLPAIRTGDIASLERFQRK